MDENIKTIPYGISDFSNMRELNGYYVDNTWGIPLLEQLPYQMFLRPRRFGKTLLLSILHYYYDINATSRFDELFCNTWIHEHPTPFKGKYLVLHFDFSKVKGNTLEEFQQSFESTCKTTLDLFLCAYLSIIPQRIQDEIAKKKTFSEAFDVLATGLGIATDKKIYILIDEYDNFTNRLLAQEGEEAYRKLCHGNGFFKSFFALLKAENKVIQRIFLTGISPMTLDDVTSGFNIAENISQRSNLATLCGFTHIDICKILNYYTDMGRFTLDQEQAFQRVTDWYDHYRFSLNNTKQVCNPVMLMGFLERCMAEEDFPRNMIDENLRTDYHKLQHLVTTNGKLNGKFHALENLVADGSVATDFVESFQVETLTKPENFISLLYYYGMVTFEKIDFEGVRFKIPNQLMQQFIADFLIKGYVNCCKVNPQTTEIAQSLGAMARKGNWRPVIDLASQVLKDTLCARDLMDGEKAVQAAFASLLSAGSAFFVHTEHSAGFGFADLTLAPRLRDFLDIAYAAIIEVKYIKKTVAVADTAKTMLLSEAKAQLEKYATDHNLADEWHLKPNGTVTLIRLAVVFHGEELLFAEEI
ncbi:MAG: AAA family ATPase [Victivallales bacterium]|nr:AAA family ATPase [Victivallales bacterium]